MRRFKHWLLKPEYLYRPSQIWRRISANRLQVPIGIRLPWGVPFVVPERDAIGSSLLRLGVYDLALSEVIWRLLDPGETVADVGANIGYVTALSAARTGRAGHVIAFEPHPLIFQDLHKNVTLWGNSSCASVDIRREAVSNHQGDVHLRIPTGFLENRGVATLEGEGGELVEVRAVTLYHALGTAPPDLLKVDVEGHESAVFEGGADLLREGRIRDIVFEDHGRYPNENSRILEGYSYSLFEVGRQLNRPDLIPIRRGNGRTVWEARNILATLEPERALRRMAPRGWEVLRSVGRSQSR